MSSRNSKNYFKTVKNFSSSSSCSFNSSTDLQSALLQYVISVHQNQNQNKDSKIMSKIKNQLFGRGKAQNNARKVSSLKKMIFGLYSPLELLFPPAEAIYYGEKIAQQKVFWQEYAQQNSARYQNNNRTQLYQEKLPISLAHYIMYGYCLVMVVRYWLSAAFLFAGTEQAYFRLDIVLELVHRKGNFDRIAFALVAFLLLYTIAIHYIRVYRTDLPILEQQTALLGGARRHFGRLYPAFVVHYKSRNVLKTAANLVVKSAQLVSRFEEFKRLADHQSFDNSRVHLQAQVLLTGNIIELTNILFFVLLSKLLRVLFLFNLN